MTVASCNTSRINYGTLLRINLTGAHVASDTDDDDDANYRVVLKYVKPRLGESTLT